MRRINHLSGVMLPAQSHQGDSLDRCVAFLGASLNGAPRAWSVSSRAWRSSIPSSHGPGIRHLPRERGGRAAGNELVFLLADASERLPHFYGDLGFEPVGSIEVTRLPA